jgi:hypothetical protein
MPVLGNHDIFTGVYLGEFALPVMPQLPDEYKEAAWSFDFGNLHVIGFYGYSEYAVMEQLPFIEADLKKASEDPAIDWIISIDHQSAYSSSVHGCVDYIQNLVSPLFDKYGVDCRCRARPRLRAKQADERRKDSRAGKGLFTWLPEAFIRRNITPTEQATLPRLRLTER